nr:ribonuclease P protein component [uncultured Campylobacter sp.]
MSDSRVFSEVYKSAAKWHCECAVVYFLASEQRKFSAVASKKIGNSITRNRAKRRLRAAFYNQQNSIDSGIFILIAKKQMNDMSFSELERNLKWALKKIGAVK